MQFDQHFSDLSLHEQEAAYFVGNKVLKDILGENAGPVIDNGVAYSSPWGISRVFNFLVNIFKASILSFSPPL